MGPSNNWCIDTNVLKRKRRQQPYSKHGQNCQSVSVVHVIKWKMPLNFKDETLASTTCLFHALLLNCYLESPLQCSLCDHAKMFLTSKFSDLLFRKLTYKTQRGDCKQVGTTNSKPPGSIIMIGQSKTGSRNQIMFITLFSSRCAEHCCAFYQPQQKTDQICRGKTILLSQTGTCLLYFIRF